MLKRIAGALTAWKGVWQCVKYLTAELGLGPKRPGSTWADDGCLWRPLAVKFLRNGLTGFLELCIFEDNSRSS